MPITNGLFTCRTCSRYVSARRLREAQRQFASLPTPSSSYTSSAPTVASTAAAAPALSPSPSLPHSSPCARGGPTGFCAAISGSAVRAVTAHDERLELEGEQRERQGRRRRAACPALCPPCLWLNNSRRVATALAGDAHPSPVYSVTAAWRWASSSAGEGSRCQGSGGDTPEKQQLQQHQNVERRGRKEKKTSPSSSGDAAGGGGSTAGDGLSQYASLAALLKAREAVVEVPAWASRARAVAKGSRERWRVKAASAKESAEAATVRTTAVVMARQAEEHHNEALPAEESRPLSPPPQVVRIRGDDDSDLLSFEDAGDITERDEAEEAERKDYAASAAAAPSALAEHVNPMTLKRGKAEEQQQQKQQRVDTSPENNNDSPLFPPIRIPTLEDVERELEAYDSHTERQQQCEDVALEGRGSGGDSSTTDDGEKANEENDSPEDHSEGYQAAVVAKRAVTSRLVLDPVEYLGQPSSTPLMAAEALQQRIAPDAFHFFSPRRAERLFQRYTDDMRAAAAAAADAAHSSSGSTAAAPQAAEAITKEEVERPQAVTGGLAVADGTQEIQARATEDKTNETQEPQAPEEAAATSTSAAAASTTPEPLAPSASNAITTTAAVAPRARPSRLLNEPDILPSDTTNTSSSTTAATIVTTTADSASGNDSESPSGPAVPPTALLFNVFTRRVVQAGSPSVRSLAVLGIAPSEAAPHDLRVAAPDTLRLLGEELRAGRVQWPAAWTNGGRHALFSQVRAILTAPDTPEGEQGARRSSTSGSGSGGMSREAQVAALLELHYARVRRSRRSVSGVVVSQASGGDGDEKQPASGTSGSAGVEDAVALPSGEASAAGGAPHSGGVEDGSDKLLSLADLNAEQRAVVDFVMSGHNVYIGGGAGTGKSVLLRVLRQQLQREGLSVAVTATTGVAACQLGGATLHHTFGINLLGDFTRRRELSAYDVVIIDEVSMLSRELFESLEHHLRRAHGSGVQLPFGGVQMILCGDFLQLGAIGSETIVNAPLFRHHFAMLKLRTVVRQSGHAAFSAQLGELRRGRLPAALAQTVRALPTAAEAAAERRRAELLAERQREQLRELRLLTDSAGVAPPAGEGPPAVASAASASAPDADAAAGTYVEGAVNLLPTNKEVEATNLRELARLPGKETVFPAQVLTPALTGAWSTTFLISPAGAPGECRRRFDVRYVTRAVEAHVHAYYARRAAAGDRAALWAQTQFDQRSVVVYPLFRDALALRVRLPPGAGEAETEGLLRHLDTLPSLFESGGQDSPSHAASAAAATESPTEGNNNSNNSDADSSSDAESGAISPASSHFHPLRGLQVRAVLPHAEGLHTEADAYALERYAAAAPMAAPLRLKVGAKVMLRANLGPSLVNGSLGTVVGFRRLDVEELPAYVLGRQRGGRGGGGGGETADDEHYLGSRNTGGLTREEIIVQYGEYLCYEHGFAFAVLPVVDFGGREEIIPPVAHSVGGGANTHYYSLSVVALPLSLAYAFTVHKVQGLTLVGRVHLELSRMWPCEHLLYVAMSRVRNPEQLSVSGLRASLVRAAAASLLFDDSLPAVEKVRVPPHLIPAVWRRAPHCRKRVLRRRQLERLRAREESKERAQLSAAGPGSGSTAGWQQQQQSRRRRAAAAVTKGGRGRGSPRQMREALEAIEATLRRRRQQKQQQQQQQQQPGTGAGSGGSDGGGGNA